MLNRVSESTSLACAQRWARAGMVVLALSASGLWLACGSDDSSPAVCTGSDCDGGTDGDGGGLDATDDQHVPDGCDLTKDPKDSAACVDDTIALFVSPAGSDANSGTKTAPLKTINAAIGKTDSQHTRVYVCAGAYNENVKVTTGTKTAGIYAGFSCSDWSYAGGAPNAVVTSTNGYALEVNNLNTTLTVEDVEFDSPDAQKPGDSSIAVFITQSTGVILKRVNAKAGKGADGADAVATDGDAGTAPTGNSGTSNTGGLACSNSCPNGTSTGGKGGTGVDTGATAGGGQDGGPDIAANPPLMVPPWDGNGGQACGGLGSHHGANGHDADAGASGGSTGSVTVVGWSTVVASAGSTGGVGQGGGGGGGGVNTTDGDNKGGGGGGGCGGCGGGGGSGGGSAGSSFGILVFQSTVTIDSSAVESTSGGNGKQGGIGRNGQGGGVRGEATPGGNGCPGGAGGSGGAGAGGGGGAAGNSIALGYLGTPPTVTSTTFTKGSAGTPGGGGTGAAGNNGLAGAAGISAEQQDLKP